MIGKRNKTMEGMIMGKPITIDTLCYRHDGQKGGILWQVVLSYPRNMD